MVEKIRYYWFKLSADGDPFRVRADEMEKAHDHGYKLMLEGECVGHVTVPAAWWVEDEKV